MGFLALLGPVFTTLTKPIADYFSYKVKEKEAEREYKLAALKAQTAQATAELKAESNNLSYRLDATTKEFKQNTFWLLLVPVAVSICLPDKAEVMWYNFGLMPDWFQWLFLSVYSSIWGIPIVKGGYGAVTDLLSSRRDYKIEKAKVDRKAVFDVLKQMFPKGMNQAQVTIVDQALDAGEQGR